MHTRAAKSTPRSSISQLLRGSENDSLGNERYHLENPYWKTFDPYVIPLLAKDMDLRRHNELDTSEKVRIEQDPELWKAVEKHQTS